MFSMFLSGESVDETSDAEVDWSVKLIEINNFNTDNFSHIYLSLFSLIVFMGKTSYNFVFISCPAVANKLDLYIEF